MNNKQKGKEYVAKLLSEGANEIKFTWEGGNDEGSFHLYVDGVEIDFDYKNKDGAYDLVDYLADGLDYGSFAGDFNTNGELIYDVDKGAFIGYDSCEQTEQYAYKFKKPLVLTIPKDILWFDTVEVDISGYSDEMDVSLRLNVINGPVVEEHFEFEKKAVKSIYQKVDELYDDIDEVRDAWYNRTFDREELTLDKDGNAVLTLTEIDYSRYEGEEKEINIQL